MLGGLGGLLGLGAVPVLNICTKPQPPCARQLFEPLQVWKIATLAQSLVPWPLKSSDWQAWNNVF